MITQSGEELKLVGGGEFFAVHNNLCLLGSAVVPAGKVGHASVKVFLQFPERDFTVTVPIGFLVPFSGHSLEKVFGEETLGFILFPCGNLIGGTCRNHCDLLRRRGHCRNHPDTGDLAGEISPLTLSREACFKNNSDGGGRDFTEVLIELF